MPEPFVYIDKSLDEPVSFRVSETDYLVMLNTGDEETLGAALGNNIASISNVEGNLYKITLDQSFAETAIDSPSPHALLKSNSGVIQIANGLIDADGNCRFMEENRVVVYFSDITTDKVENLIAGLGSKIVKTGNKAGLFIVKVPEGQSVSFFIDKLNKIPELILAEPNFIGIDDEEIQTRITTRLGNSDAEAVGPVYWNHDRICAPSAWKYTLGSARVAICVVDGMPDGGHEALHKKGLYPVTNDLIFSSSPKPSTHATNIAGLLIGASDSIIGIAPACSVIPLVVNLKVQSYSQRADAIWRAVKIATEKKIANTSLDRIILCCSWRTRGDISIIRLAMRDAVAAGIPVICSAGNSATQEPHYPSDYSAIDTDLKNGVISVAATDKNDLKATYSNYSKKIDVAAPGGDGLPRDEGDILCAALDNRYSFNAGTSLSAPHVAAVAALMLSIDASLTTNQIKEIIKEAVDSFPTTEINSSHLGSGRLNGLKAVKKVLELTRKKTTKSVPSGTQDTQLLHVENSGPRIKIDTRANVASSLKENKMNSSSSISESHTLFGTSNGSFVTPFGEMELNELLLDIAHYVSEKTDWEVHSVTCGKAGKKQAFRIADLEKLNHK